MLHKILLPKRLNMGLNKTCSSITTLASKCLSKSSTRNLCLNRVQCYGITDSVSNFSSKANYKICSQLFPASHLSTTAYCKEKNNVEEGDANKNVLPKRKGGEETETHGQPLHRFENSYTREQAAGQLNLHDKSPGTNNYQVDIASEHHADVYNHMPSVNLSATMQSQVPEPYGKSPTHMNMPGGMNRREVSNIQFQSITFQQI